MTPELFFEKFDQLADAPGAVAKMRELVLELAVQGRLLHQDPNDGTAADLIAHLADSYNTKASERVRTDEVPFHIPSTWSWVRLGSIALGSDSGWSPTCETEPRTGIEWGVLKVSAVSWGSFKPEENKALLPGSDPRPNCEVREGDFLLSRANTADLVARSVIARAVPPRLMMSDKIVRFTFPEQIEKGYVHLANSSVYARAYYAQRASGTSSSMKNVSREVMSNLPLPLPPLAEQKRIVAKVDELMALCDRLDAQQRERDERQAVLTRASLAQFSEAPTAENLELLFHGSYEVAPAELRKMILALAVRGKLVPQEPHDEPEFNRSSVAEAIKKLALHSSVDEFKNENCPFQVPKRWRWVTISEVAEARLGKMLDKEKNRGDEYPYLRNTNVHWFRFELEDVKTMRFERSELDEFRVQPGDVLICEGGHGIARTAVWNGQIAEIMFQKALHRVRPRACLEGHFLSYCIRVYEQIGVLQRYYTGAGIPHFTGKALARVVFPLPPLAEQKRIVAKVDELMALVDRLEAQLTESRATATRLLDALVAELTAAEWGVKTEAAPNGTGSNGQRVPGRRAAMGREEVVPAA